MRKESGWKRGTAQTSAALRSLMNGLRRLFFPLVYIVKTLLVWVMRRVLTIPVLRTPVLRILDRYPQLKQRLRLMASVQGPRRRYTQILRNVLRRMADFIHRHAPHLFVTLKHNNFTRRIYKKITTRQSPKVQIQDLPISSPRTTLLAEADANDFHAALIKSIAVWSSGRRL
jgi:hypothetical protein